MGEMKELSLINKSLVAEIGLSTFYDLLYDILMNVTKYFFF